MDKIYNINKSSLIAPKNKENIAKKVMLNNERYSQWRLKSSKPNIKSAKKPNPITRSISHQIKLSQVTSISHQIKLSQVTMIDGYLTLGLNYLFDKF